MGSVNPFQEERMREKIRTIAIAAVVSALAVAGLAVAQDDGDGGATKKRDRFTMAVPPPPGGPGFGGPGLEGRPGNLTYSETHFRKDGEDVTVRVDKGKLTAVGDDSVTIDRNDGESVEIPVDGDTKALAGPRKRDTELADLEGKNVIVVRKSGSEAAEAVGAVPKHPMRMRFRGGPPGGKGFGPHAMPVPPPGVDQG
jgi:hypothetical protein